MTAPSNIDDQPKKFQVKIEVDQTDLDSAIEKANRLVVLLQTANDIIDSLSRGLRSEA